MIDRRRKAHLYPDQKDQVYEEQTIAVKAKDSVSDERQEAMNRGSWDLLLKMSELAIGFLSHVYNNNNLER